MSRNSAIAIMLSCFCLTTLHAEPPKLKQAIGNVIQQKGKIQTGPSSRVELEFPHSTTARIGSNANFRFSPDSRSMKLDSGTLMFSSSKDAGQITISSGPVATTLIGGALEMSNVGGNAKVIILNGKILLILTGNPKVQKSLRFGQMVDVPAGATTMPSVMNIKLSTLLKTSLLFNMGAFPGKRAIEQNATKQSPPTKIWVTGGFDPDFGSGLATNRADDNGSDDCPNGRIVVADACAECHSDAGSDCGIRYCWY